MPLRREARPQDFDPAPVDAEVGVADPGGRADVHHRSVFVDKQLEVVDEPEEQTGALGMEIEALGGNDPGSRKRLHQISKPPESRLGRTFEGQRLDSPGGVGRAAADTVGRGGTGSDFVRSAFEPLRSLGERAPQGEGEDDQQEDDRSSDEQGWQHSFGVVDLVSPPWPGDHSGGAGRYADLRTRRRSE